MKKIRLGLVSAFSVLSLVSAGSSYAASHNGLPEALNSKNFSFDMLAQSRFSLVDTTRGSTMDSFSQLARFGANYKFKRLSSSLLLQFDGGSAGDTGGNTRILEASLGYKLLDFGDSSLTVTGGREHLSSSVIYAPDAFNSYLATNLANQYLGEDGIGLTYELSTHMINWAFGVGTYNALPVKVLTANGYLTSQSPTSQIAPSSASGWNKSSPNSGRAYTFQMHADTPVMEGKAVLNALYGFQDKASMDSNAASVRDIGYFEGSLGYEADKKDFQAGIWYQDTSIGKLSRNVSPNGITQHPGADYNYVAVARSSTAPQNTLGFGFKGTSELWGWSNFTGDNVGDVMTFGGGYQKLNGVLPSVNYALTTTGTDPITPMNSASIDAVNLAVGYKYSVAEFELNYVNMNADKSIFYSQNNVKTDYRNWASMVYLTGIITL